MADHATGSGGRHLTLRIVTPEATVYDGPAASVVVPSHDGETAFLIKHAPFVGLLGAGEIRFADSVGAVHRHFLAGGVVQVVDDIVTVLADAVAPVETLDAAKAQTELTAASARPSANDEQRSSREKAITAARAKLRLANRG